MGMIYELLSTPVAYAARPYYDRHPPVRSHGPVRIDFGSDPLQHCVVWEPAEVKHPEVVMYFHGGGYLVGAPESMRHAADVYNTMGYRFCSVGFRLMPHDCFPAQVDDAFAGVKAAVAWLESHGIDASRLVVGGSSCGGHLAYLLAYSRELQRTYGFDAEHICGVVSVAGVAEADDMLLKYFGTPALRRAFLDMGFTPGERVPRGTTSPGANPATATDWSKPVVHGWLRAYSPLYLAQQDDVPQIPLFVIHGRADKMSPYDRSVDLVQALNARHPGLATLRVIHSWWWQHMILTVCLHKQSVEQFGPLRDLFRWMEENTAEENTGHIIPPT